MIGEPESPSEKRASHPAVAEIAMAARDIFGTNLRLSFVAGSHAHGAAGAYSDVDVLVLIDRPDPGAERAFAAAFRQSHIRHGLKLDHYGEIFDVVTAMRLMSYTAAVLCVTDRIQATACYHGDCILSIFRKGDVLMKFFLDEKVAVQGDLTLLATLEANARAFFTSFPMPRVQLAKRELVVPDDVGAAADFRRWSNVSAQTDPVDSPLGISLERWFTVDPIGLDRAIAANSDPAVTGPRHLCPLVWTIEDERLGQIVRHQCLGTTGP